MKSRVIVYSFLVLFVICAFIFKSNKADFYAKIGDFYYKKNEIVKAQNFYEQSLVLGNKDKKFRESYINSIITSPLTLQSQEKLVYFAESDINDNASTKAKQFLYDLKREIHNSYPLNYIKQAAYNQKIVRWNNFPITYAFKSNESIPSYYKEEIEKAFYQWERLGVVLFSETDKNADIVINFRNNNNENAEYGRKYVVAYTLPQIVGDNLQCMNILFCIKDLDGNYFSKNQIYNTALHEIFHALGFMGHSFERGNIMYLSKENDTLLNDIRLSLTEPDVQTFKLLYSIEPDITNSRSIKGKYLPYLVLGDDEEITYTKQREAKNYINKAPTLPSGYIDLAESLVAQKRYSEAIKNLEKALNLADTKEIKYIIYYNLAVSYHYITHYDMALDYIGLASEIKNSEELQFLKAEVLLEKNKELAKKEYIALIKNYPSNPDYVLRLAGIYVKEYSYLKARKVLKSYLNLYPQYKQDERFKNFSILIF